jgi:hypothetical protein
MEIQELLRKSKMHIVKKGFDPDDEDCLLIKAFESLLATNNIRDAIIFLCAFISSHSFYSKSPFSMDYFDRFWAGDLKKDIYYICRQLLSSNYSLALDLLFGLCQYYKIDILKEIDSKFEMEGIQ